MPRPPEIVIQLCPQHLGTSIVEKLPEVSHGQPWFVTPDVAKLLIL